jgi:hypothetical protein
MHLLFKKRKQWSFGANFFIYPQSYGVLMNSEEKIAEANL